MFNPFAPARRQHPRCLRCPACGGYLADDLTHWLSAPLCAWVASPADRKLAAAGYTLEAAVELGAHLSAAIPTTKATP
jgi:hypothetical protein